MFGRSSNIFAAGTPAIPSPHLDDLDALVSAFRSLQLTPEAPLRTEFGTAGSRINLRANFFAIQLPQRMLLYDYEVWISPNTRDSRRARIFQLLEASPECAPYAYTMAHDSKQRIVSIDQLPQPLRLKIPCTDPGRSNLVAEAPVFVVQVFFIRCLDIADMIL